MTKAVTFGSGGRRIFSPSLVSVLLPLPCTALVTRVVARVYRKRRKAKKKLQRKSENCNKFFLFLCDLILILKEGGEKQHKKMCVMMQTASSSLLYFLLMPARCRRQMECVYSLSMARGRFFLPFVFSYLCVLLFRCGCVCYCLSFSPLRPPPTIERDVLWFFLPSSSYLLPI